jgi:ABC-type lipoprotein release transport system permease subunit
VGIAAALVTAQAFRSLLFEVAPWDWAASGGAGAVLLGLSALAAALPAVRASRVNAADTLRRSD